MSKRNEWSDELFGNKKEPKVCPLCEREVNKTTDHHLIPDSKDKRSNKVKKKHKSELTVAICEDCHHQIHALFDNNELKNNLNTVEKLKANEKMQKFIKWIGKKDPRHNQRFKQSNRRNR